MDRLAERRSERAAITKWYDDSKRSIHENYMTDLQNLEVESRRRLRALMTIQNKEMNAALEMIDQDMYGR